MSKLCSHAGILAAVLFLAVAQLQGQDAPQLKDKQAPQAENKQAPTFSANVKVVSLLATVRDKHGAVVSNLGKDDFKLEEDGRPQTIKYFTRDTDLPLTLGLLVDTSLSQRRVLDQERTASYKFLQDVLRESKDNAFVIHFDRETELLQDLTSSRDKLEAALDELKTPDLEYQRTSSPDPGQGGRQRRAGTVLYDAVFLSSDELMKKQQGRKAVIILSDGVDMGSKVSLDRAIETAQRSDTLVYSILFSDKDAYNNAGGFGGPRMGGGGPWGGHRGGMGGGYPGGGGGGYPGGGGGRYPQQGHADGKKVLQRLSKETGGRFFEVSTKETIDDIYKQISEELRNQYSIGYTPDRPSSSSGDYHKIHLTTTQKDDSVQTRDGYYSD
jgi:VWFA-related protein